jgi:hypothetical protein
MTTWLPLSHSDGGLRATPECRVCGLEVVEPAEHGMCIVCVRRHAHTFTDPKAPADWESLAGGAWKAMIGRRPAVVFPAYVWGARRWWQWQTGRCFGDGRKGYAPTLEAAQTMAEAAARGEND